MAQLSFDRIFDSWEQIKNGEVVDITDQPLPPPPPPPAPSSAAEQQQQLNTDTIVASIIRLYQQFIEWSREENKKGVTLERNHTCDPSCKCFSGDQTQFHICKKSGNVHNCTLTTCEYLCIYQDRCVCPLTNNPFERGTVLDDKDVYDDASTNQFDITAEMKNTSSFTSHRYSSGASDGRVALHPTHIQARHLAYLKEVAKQTESDSPQSSSLTKVNKNNKRRFTDIDAISRFDDTRTKSVAQQQQQEGKGKKQQPKRSRDSRPRHSLNPDKQHAKAFTDFRRVLGSELCVCTHSDHIDQMVKHCCDLWRIITQGARYQEKGGGATLYTFQNHCKIVIHHMVKGIRNKHGHTIVPAVLCLEGIDMDKLMGNASITTINKRFMEYLALIPTSIALDLHKAAILIQ